MALTVAAFEERIADSSPSSAGFSLRTARATSSFIVRVNMTTVPDYDGPVFNEDSEVLPLDLINLPQVVLGGVNTDVGDGRLNRLLPLAHPQWPWMYAQNITSVRGIGAGVKFDSISPLEALPMPSFYLYPTYEVVIEFSAVNYAVLPDNEVQLNNFDPKWTDVNGNNAPNADQRYATESLRFTEYQTAPQNDWVTASIGNGFVFKTQGGSGSADTDPGANGGALYAAMPRVLLPNEIIKFTWHMVPFRYYSSANSYLRRFRGKINQNAWYNWNAGELLYLNCAPIRYTPPILQPVNWLLGTSVVEKWCDMEIIFLATARNGVNLPTTANANVIAGGHNLMPWQGDNQFYFVVSKATNFGTFSSFPAELLFTDPDSNAGNFINNEGGGPRVLAPNDINPLA